MSPRFLRASALFAALCLTATSCADAGRREIVAPADHPTGPAQGLLTELLVVNVLQRLQPLSQSYSASATIGTAGGTIRIPQTGFTITFPAGAVAQPVTVQVTALAGRNVAYRFEPHGLVFLKEPVIAQDLGLTEAVMGLLPLTQLEGGYYPQDGLLGAGVASVSETRPARIGLLPLRMTFSIAHFSGYVAASGRRGGGYLSGSGSRIATDGPFDP
jgi:hypothetical protein